MGTNWRADDPILAAIIDRLVEEFSPLRIYLFGSKARGDDGPDSDYDLMVVLENVDEPAHRLSQRALDLLWEVGVGADVLFMPRHEFDARLHSRASLPGTIAREGRQLYAA